MIISISAPEYGRSQKNQMYYEEKRCPLKAAVKASTDYECDKRCAWYDEINCKCAILILAQATEYISNK